MSDETPIFNPKLPRADHRRGEWVELEDGRLYVREMNARDSLFVLEHSQRPAGPGQGMGLNLGSLQTWQIVVSCYNGEGPEARRIFDITDVEAIQSLRSAEWRKILDAVERVNALSDQEVSDLADFTAAGAAGSPETSSSGASNNSTGFPEKSSFPPANSLRP